MTHHLVTPRRSGVGLFILMLVATALLTLTLANPVQAQTGTITVTALDSVTNNPIPNVQVNLFSSSGSPSACTNANGEAIFNELAFDVAYSIRGGNGIFDRNCDANYATTNVETPITLTSGTATQSAQIVLEQAGTIEGTVITTDRMWGLVFDANTGTVLANDISDAVNGSVSYSMRGIPFDVDVVIGAYALAFTPTGSVITKGIGYYNSAGNVPVSADAESLNVTNVTPTLTGINLNLADGATISGTVFASDGTTPLEDVPVAINGGDFFLERCTDENGEYVISGVQAGQGYTITAGGAFAGETRVSTCSDQTQPLVWYNGVDNEGEANLVVGGSTGINFNMSGDPVGGPFPTNLATDETNYTEPTDLTAVFPDFSWTGVEGVENYRLYVRNSNNRVIIDETFNDACGGIVCEVISDGLLPRWGLVDGTYEWWVGAIFADNSVAWNGSTPATFSVDLPAAALPDVTVDERTGRPLVTWVDDPNTLWMQVYLGPAGDKTYTKWVERNGNPEDALPDYTCEAGTCSFDPEWDAPGGDYTAWLRAWSPGGYSSGGPLENAPQWAGDEFSLPTTQTDMSTLSPSFVGSDGTDLNFTWTGSEVATWYQIYITNDDGPPYTSFVAGQWVTATELGCDGNPTAGTCEYTAVSVGPNLTVDTGYALWIRAYGPGGFGTGGLNGGVWLRTDFTYTVNP